ncbi:hypothetical protein FEM48_Zijuj03G0140000 [Ziziphus jujuba var. spinosa]|uniref:Endoglucanase n=1 Tax=Ziziphus jujuba var. spinosa TaxID=714518 RepID=A0A978VQQ5_ZIZJJ|nr:hypothetical protein FEM48_Zijuj03G0140000 [Ziziphus jujuba var. spinosa]
MNSNSRLVVLTWMIMAIMERAAAESDYAEALTKSILFYEGQRSGKLPSSQRMTWRKDSALTDGSDIGMDLVGGYYDAGDNVKFHLPMAFTVTILSWSVIEFGQFMDSDLQHALEAIRWGTDYFLKATSKADVVVAQVGDPYGDHDCWERPEDMDTPRTSYFVDKEHPGSEVSAEIAASLAASSIAFSNSDSDYSALLLSRAVQVFQFADTHRGSYNDSIGNATCPFYCDFNGYMDELVWAASWLYKATKEANYWNYVKENMQGGNIKEFGWDAKHAGINWAMTDPSDSNLFIPNADQFVCSIFPQSPTKSVSYTPGGLMFKPGGFNMQTTMSISFLLVVYAQYMKAASKTIQCEGFVADPSGLVSLARTQVDYVLGNNPLSMSYMVGYGEKFPQKIHHRGSTMPSIEEVPEHIGCRDGDAYFNKEGPNPNVLIGALVGGPVKDDSFKDSRSDIAESEPTTYYNAPFVGLSAYFKAN